MKQRNQILLTSLTLLLGSAADGGTLSPELEEAIAVRNLGDAVEVIIRCEDPLDPGVVAPDELLTALRNKAAACETSLGEVLENTALDPPQTLWIINGIAARVPVAALHGLVHRAGIDTIYLNRTVELPPEPELASVPGNPANPYWNIDETRAPDLWAQGIYGTGVVVATLDTGVDAAHADLGSKQRGGKNSWFDPNGEHEAPFDANGHGTGVMGLILAGNQTWFDLGMAPDARWIAAKIFNDQGLSDFAKIHLAFQWVLDPDGNRHTDDAPDIVNNSWVLQGTTDQCFGEFSADIAALRAADIAVVFSAGNYGPGSSTSVAPANDPGSLSVGATDSYDNVATFSSRGPSACGGGNYPGVSAPGKDVLTTALTGNGGNPTAIAFGTGTSFAAPHVAGALALLKSAVPGASSEQLESALEGGAFDLGDSGPDNEYGAGLVDVVDAYYLLEGGTPPPSDADEDGVADSADLCPSTPLGEAVDANGCSAGQLDSDGDGVSDALDLCPDTPSGETADANGCSASQRDSDGDGVNDALDQCPGTPESQAVDAVGCPVSVSYDLDGDGFSTDGSTALDCDDGDASVYPGAPETRYDGIDQDCNGFDLTIEITLARYLAKQDKLEVRATSSLNGEAALRVTVGLRDGGNVDRALTWSDAKSRWQETLRPFSRDFGSPPSSVRVYGPEGEVAVDL